MTLRIYVQFAPAPAAGGGRSPLKRVALRAYPYVVTHSYVERSGEKTNALTTHTRPLSLKKDKQQESRMQYTVLSTTVYEYYFETKITSKPLEISQQKKDNLESRASKMTSSLSVLVHPF